MEKFKRIVKQLVLSFIVVLFIYSCQKDDAVPLASQTQQSEHSTTKTVSASEIPKVMQFLQSKSNSRLEFLVDDSNTELGMYRSHEENLSMTNALTEHIKMMTNAYGKSNYTFELIEQDDKTGIYFINLVVKEYRDTLYMYIIKYVPDTSWLQTHHMIKDFNVFTGKLYIYNDLGVYVGKVEMLDGQATLGFQKHPCNGESGTSTSTGSTTGTSSGVGTNSSSTVGESSTSSSGTTTGGGSEGIPCRWEIYESDDCDCVPNLVIICPEEAFDVDRSALSNALRHPCDGNGAGSSGNLNNPDCEEEDPCNFPMYLDENCDCVDVEAIENSGVAVVNSDKEHCKKLNELWEVQNLKNQIQTLKSASIVNNDNFTSEKGFKTFIDSNGNLDAASIQTGASNGSFRYGTGVNVAVGVHTHPSVRFPMFSVDDILNLHGFYENVINSDLPVSPQTPAHLLVTNQGVYALKIEDPALFAIYYATFLNDYKRIKDERSKLEKKYRRYFDEINNQQGNSGQHKLAFLRYAKNIGVSLYQANDDLTNWTKYEISENNLDLVPSPCE